MFDTYQSVLHDQYFMLSHLHTQAVLMDNNLMEYLIRAQFGCEYFI